MVLFAVSAVAMSSLHPYPVVGSKWEVLFDRFWIERADGFSMTLNAGVKDPSPVLEPKEPWEARGVWAWGSVIKEGDRVRLWYDAIGDDGRWRMCYAESRDGVHFDRPALGIYQYKGRETNICFEAPKGFHMGSVFFDPHAEPDERYKITYGGGGHIGDSPYMHIALAVSPDGLRWRHVSDSIIPWYTDTMNVCYWDATARLYRLFTRYWTGRMRYENNRIVGRDDYGKRAVGCAESKNPRKFPAPRIVLAPDEQDPPDMDLYNSAAVICPGAARMYLLFPSCFYHTPDTLDVQIATSRDGCTWKRPFRKPIVPLGLKGAFDSEEIYMYSGIIDTGEEFWMYYGGFTVGHDETHVGKTSARTGRVRWRRHGFISWDAPMSGGELVTKPFVFHGATFECNVNASAGGFLRVGLETPDGKPIEGFGTDKCNPVYGNRLAARFSWKTNKRLSDLNGTPVRLHFIGRACKLYAFRFVK